jgi:phosphorylcholine metabolism protein LicD
MKLKDHEEKLRAQFTKEELKRIGKHDSFQHELKLQMDRLEEKIKSDMDIKEKNLRNKVPSERKGKKKRCVTAVTPHPPHFPLKLNIDYFSLFRLRKLRWIDRG